MVAFNIGTEPGAKRVPLKSPVRENRTPGSARGLPGNREFLPRYKPELGRWINRDPIGEEGGRIFLVRNPNVRLQQKEPEYLAFLNNAIDRTDALGLTSYASNVRWRYAVIYRRDGWGWGAGGGNTRTANIGLGATFPRRRVPCWRAYMFIVQARPINNPNFEPSMNADDALRVFEFNNGLYGPQRYFPIVEFTMAGNSWQDRLWRADQSTQTFDAGAPSFPWAYRYEATPAPILFGWNAVSIHLNRIIRVVVSGGEDENLGTSIFRMENETGPAFSQ